MSGNCKIQYIKDKVFWHIYCIYVARIKNQKVMLHIKQIKNTVLLSFDKKVKLDNSNSKSFKDEILNLLTKPFTNMFVDLMKVERVDEEGLNALLAGYRLSEMNQSQMSLFNVSENVLNAMRRSNLDSHFYFVDRPKPFSEDLLMV